jgi:transcriptional regulator with XRE-family HTH domain
MRQTHPIRAQNDETSGGDAVEPPAEERRGAERGRQTPRVTFGEELRRERELRRIGLREVAESTKINRRYLEALERNDFSRLPGGLFNRSFVRAYCQTIGIDPEAMVNAYLLEEQIQAAKADRFDPDVWRGDPASRTPAGPAGASAARLQGRRAAWTWVLLLVLLVLTVAAAWVCWRLLAGGAEGQPDRATRGAGADPAAQVALQRPARSAPTCWLLRPAGGDREETRG